MGVLDQEVTLDDGVLSVGRHDIRMLLETDPSALPWAELGVDVVIESTGVFRDRASITQHLDAGAGRVLLTVPAKDEIDATIVLGVNDAELSAEDRIVSNASCTTNCLAPLVKVLDDQFGIKRGVMTTVHAYTNDQRLAEWAHSDLRRSRAATENIIPTTDRSGGGGRQRVAASERQVGWYGHAGSGVRWVDRGPWLSNCETTPTRTRSVPRSVRRRKVR